MAASNNLNDLWPYLPAFRAIAETEHLSAAAAQLHVVPSALSRSLRLLENAIGMRLFSRAAGRLRLNQHGRALLDALRQGMHAIERGAFQAADRTLEGEYRVGTLGVLTNHVVLPVLLELTRKNPRLQPVMRNHKGTEANHRLVLGDLDLAFFYDAVPFRGVHCRKLGVLTNAIYCGRAHPLYRARRVDRETLLSHAFSVPSLGDRNTPMDGWPVHLERQVGFHIELLWTNLEICRSGRFLTVLPDVVAAPHLRARELRRFDAEIVPPVEVYGACRDGEESSGLTAELLEAAAAHVRSLPSGS